MWCVCTHSRSLLKLMSIESVMPSDHLILCCPLLILRSIFPSIRVFSNESALCIRWPKYWSFSFNISLSNKHPGLVSFGWTGWIFLQSKGLSRVFSNTTVQKHQFFSVQFLIVHLSHPYMTTGKTIARMFLRLGLTTREICTVFGSQVNPVPCL